MEAWADFVERQRGLQREAAEVTRDLRVEETLGRAGRVLAVGSFVTGLMVWRDLDYVVDASGLTTAAAFEVMYPLLARSRAAHYGNDTELRRHYFVLRIPWRDDREWKLDVSLFVAGIPPDLEASQDELRTRLTDETRATILMLKDAWCAEPAYPEVVGGFEIYDAVLHSGVLDLDQLDAYLHERGLPTRFVEGCGGSIRVNPPQTTFTNTRLASDRTYSCFVYALDAAGNRSGNSNTVSYTTPPDTTPPSPPPTLTATSVYPTRISVAWTTSVDNVSQVWYSLFLDGSLYFGDQIGSRAATVLYLSPSTTYVFRVIARDAYGNVAESNTLSVTTPAVTDTVPPTAPSNLTLSSESAPPEAWLDWDQSTDDTDPQSQILYDVYLNGVRNDDGIIGYGETVTYCRAEGTTTIVLRAVDTSGNVSGPSNEVVVNC